MDCACTDRPMDKEEIAAMMIFTKDGQVYQVIGGNFSDGSLRHIHQPASSVMALMADLNVTDNGIEKH